MAGGVAIAAIVLAAGAYVAVREWQEGCRPMCPTHRLYVAYDGSVADPIGHGAPRVKHERDDLERAMPGFSAYLERSHTEGLVEVRDAPLRGKVVDHFGFGDEDGAASIEVDGHSYVITWERLGDEE